MKTAVAAARLVRCHYKRRNQEMCPNPAADQSQDAHILLCAHHLAKAMQLVNDQMKAADKAGVTIPRLGTKPIKAARRTA